MPAVPALYFCLLILSLTRQWQMAVILNCMFLLLKHTYKPKQVLVINVGDVQRRHGLHPKQWLFCTD